MNYIEEHRATLEPELAEAVRAREERERYYRATDKNSSLEFVVRRLLTPDSLPTITISNLKRVDADYAYCERCAERLTEIVLDLDSLRGTPRLFIPGQAVIKR